MLSLTRAERDVQGIMTVATAAGIILSSVQVLLLTDRAFRDDARCSAKYGAYWQEYSKLVPYRVVPLLF